MLGSQFHITWAAAVVALAGLVLAAALSGPRPSLPAPASGLDPGAAVRLQLEALAHNDEPFPDAGIEATWAFASPENRAATGPLEHFRAMFRGGLYGPMIDHRAARYSETRQIGDRALVGVVLTGADGDRRGYLFQLSRHDGAPCRGCWMTDAVMPMPVGPRRRDRGPARPI
jgi:hypothetical protein